MNKKQKIYLIFNIVFLVLYVSWTIFLVLSASMNAEASTKQSNSVTTVVVETINDIAGKEVIKNNDNTKQIIRKLIGHFGGFLILGIFSSLTYFMAIRKRIYLPIIINYVSGFLIAMLTEFIQLFSNGRSGEFKDVMIDYGGFLISSPIIMVIFIIILINKRKNASC